jgi:hypothetical protein
MWSASRRQTGAAVAGRLQSHKCRRIASRNPPSELMSRLGECKRSGVGGQVGQVALQYRPVEAGQAGEVGRRDSGKRATCVAAWMST